ncbi:MAG: hypothetical protein ABI148_06050 [Ginsengibacter sp.]
MPVFVYLLLLILFEYNGNAQTQSFQLPPDTTSQKLISKNNDSILKWRQSREFAYMHYLDSLLRKEKNLKADTVSLDESGKITRNQHSENKASGFNKVLNSLLLKIFFWSLALLFIGIITFKIFSKTGIFSRKENKLIASNDEDSINDLKEISKYDTLILEAENKNQYNLATRYLFLKTLKTLADKELINFTIEKTNKEYLKEMEQNKSFNQFKVLNHNYEYIWYGKFLIDQKNYLNLKEEFILFNEKV